MDYANWRSLPVMFFEVARKSEARPFVWAKSNRQFEPVSWGQAADTARRLARGLAALGISPGDRVALVSENRPEWAIADFGIMAAGAVTVPAYVTNTVEDHRHILRSSGARAAIVSTAALARRVLAAAQEAPAMQTLITLEPVSETESGIAVHAWDDVLALLHGDDNLALRLAALEPDDIACIIHTSGTGGSPKGVMLTHRNIIANCRGAFHLLKDLDLRNEKFLSFLPLSHSYEHSAGLMFPVSIGAEIYFSHGADTLARDLLEVRPTMMTAVPRLYETLHQRIDLAMQHESEIKRRLFKLAVEIGRKRLSGQRLSIPDRLLDPLLDRLVRQKISVRFGGRLKAMISGGAPLNPEVGSFFIALGVQLLQGYGQSEAAPIICCNRPERIKVETVGPPLDGVSVRIAEDGEILVRGDNVMKGYWNAPEDTSRTLIDGWLHTGDIGTLDDDGYLRITDRKRDFIKNSGGDMISPARVESALTFAPEIGQAMVLGDQRPFLVGILVPDQDFAAAFAKEQGMAQDLPTLARSSEFRQRVGAVVNRVNSTLATAERVRHFVIAQEPFSVDNAQLTPTLKIRRHAIREAYRLDIEALYDGKVMAA